MDEPVVVAPEPAAPVAAPPVVDRDPWQADASVSEANDTQLPTVDGPAPDERNADGTFKGKSRTRRTDPTTAVIAAKKDAAAEVEKAHAKTAELQAENDRLRAAPRVAEPAKAASESAQATPPQTEGFTTAKPRLKDFFAPPADWKPEYEGDQWDPYEAHALAAASWERARWDHAEGSRRVQAEQQTQTQAAQGRLAKARETLPDLDKHIGAFDAGLVAKGYRDAHGQALCPPALMAAIVTSESIAAIVSYLGSHPEEIGAWAEMAQGLPVSAGRQVRRLLERAVTAAAPVAVGTSDATRSVPSTASAPIHRVGGAASATPVDPEDLDFGPEYIRAENAREAKRTKEGRW